ncbi:hypothetical protein FMUND_10095 [Fusarium mundagurra]|uniref:2EXR domain-containing protein n=1 Tax=Fusarium mundagurra TaxID=1567541 RepID=A0A8H5YBY1_9HYPO|nr:hypothetical protein FMUND_10095 [Fusarium mundagurra]
MEPSEIPPATEGLSKFTCFLRLPPELRVMIWECLISVQRHLRITGRFKKPATIGSFTISEGMYLSLVCCESRKVLSRIIAYQTAQDGDGTSLNRPFGTVLLTTRDAPSLELLSSITTDIDCIAIPRRRVRSEAQKLHLALHRALQNRVAAGGRQIKVIYTGISSELPDNYRPPRNHPMTPLADFEVTTDDDALSSSYPGIKFVVVYNGSSGTKKFLNLEYSGSVYHEAAVELRSTWRRLTWKDEIATPVIKPGLILMGNVPLGTELTGMAT